MSLAHRFPTASTASVRAQWSTFASLCINTIKLKISLRGAEGKLAVQHICFEMKREFKDQDLACIVLIELQIITISEMP